MKGFKGFNKGLVCRGKQYKENEVFTEEKAVPCESGMHFCENPMDVLSHYEFVNTKGKVPELNEFAEVEALDEVATDDNVKYTTTKLRIGAKLSIHAFVNAFVEFTLSKISKEDKDTNTGYMSAATNTGYRSAATNTGDRSAATNTGYMSAATNTGNMSAATNTGDRSAATNTGYRSAATNTGYRSAATNTGDRSAATNTGNMSAATNTGNMSAATNTGDMSAATVEGKESVAVAWGYKGAARGALGCYIVLAERNDDGELINARMEKVDGEKVKANTFYRLVDGELEEVQEE